MTRTHALAAASMALALAAAAAADTRIAVRQSDPGQEPHSQSLMITSGKVRMEQGGGDDTVMIYHSDGDKFFVLQTSQQSYLEIDPEATGEMMDQAAQMRAQMMAQLRERLAQMPEEQREQMEAMLEKSGQGLPGIEAPEVRYESGRGVDRVAGFTCSWVDAFEGDRKVRELCLAEPGELGLPGADRATMLSMMKSMKQMSERMGGTGMFQDDMPEGFPIHVRHLDASGAVTAEQQVEAVSQGSLDASLFEVPDGYTKRELPSLQPR